VIEVSQVNTAIKDLETKLENLITQNLETNFKLEKLSTQVNKTIKNLETKLENLEQRTIHQNLEMNLKLEKLIALINKTSSQQPIPPGINRVKLLFWSELNKIFETSAFVICL